MKFSEGEIVVVDTIFALWVPHSLCIGADQDSGLFQMGEEEVPPLFSSLVIKEMKECGSMLHLKKLLLSKSLFLRKSLKFFF